MRKIIEWAVKRPTVVNLIMVGVALAGLLAISQLPKESFPQTSLDEVRVEVPYRGASPKEIEKGILIKIEESLQSVVGISQIRSEARENSGLVRLEVQRGKKVDDVLRDVKDQVERIIFPKDSDKPKVYTLVRRVPVMQFALYGKASHAALQTQADKLKDQFLGLPKVKQVTLTGTKKREIAIEINEDNLRKYDLKIEDVTMALKRANFDLSGGTIKSKQEDFRIRVYGKKYLAKQLAPLSIRTLPGGNTIRLRDIAQVKETFEDTPQQAYFNGHPAILLNVQSVPEDDILKIAAQTKVFYKSIKKSLPQGITLSIYQDQTIALRSRISLLVKNGLQGLILVLLVLSFFMNLRLAFWVSAGLFLSILGSYVAAWYAGWSINMISLFGIMLVIGILVDDAIVVAENVYAHLEKGASPIRAAIDGTREVLPAVVTAVTTTCLTFIPLFFMGGFIGKFIYMIPAMVIVALLCSLIESMFILPPHLAHSLKRRDSLEYRQSRLRGAVDGSIKWFREKVYARLLSGSLRYRWATLSAALGMLVLSFGLVGGGLVKFVFFPAIEGDRIVMRFTMRPGTPLKVTEKHAKKVEAIAKEINSELREKYKQDVVVSSLMWLGRHTNRGPNAGVTSGAEVAEIQLELLPGEKRKINSFQIISKWRKRVGEIPGAIQKSFGSLDTPPLGRPLEFQLTSTDPQQLAKAATYLKKRLATFPGVYGPEDNLNIGKREVQMKRTELARSLNIPMQLIANQVRYRVYGQEVMRLQRGRDEVRVVVRYPEKYRDSMKRLNNIWIKDSKGQRHPLSQLVTWESSRELNVIRRIDRKRQAVVFAQLDESQGNQQTIVRSLRKNEFKKLAVIAPSVKVEMGGQGKEQAKVIGGMSVAFPLAMFGIFFTLALIFQSYGKILIVMAMIPFGLIGAVLGHWLVGIPLTILSFFGIVGVSGVVVNDSIVLMDAINRHVEKGHPVFEAVSLAGQSRLRAILSTTLTTAAGLFPLLMERSLQAQFLIPMALSLAAGVVFATFLTLFLVPSLYLIRNDVKRVVYWLRKGEWLDADTIEHMGKHKDEEEDQSGYIPTPAPATVPVVARQS